MVTEVQPEKINWDTKQPIKPLLFTLNKHKHTQTQTAVQTRFADSRRNTGRGWKQRGTDVEEDNHIFETMAAGSVIKKV